MDKILSAERVKEIERENAAFDHRDRIAELCASHEALRAENQRLQDEIDQMHRDAAGAAI